ncbi:MAG: pseudouridine synthase [Candidatus Omnitrophota bacterium]
MQRVQKLLSNYGSYSRRKAEELIKQGRVIVNQRVISIGDKASPGDKIYVDSKLIKKQKAIYLMLNKPLGCITALKDKKFKTIMHYIKVEERVFPIGRLDYNTSGLLLLTNDGNFANRILHPRYEIKKTYLVGIDKPISADEIASIESGLTLKDGKTKPIKAKKHNSVLLEITTHEGKNRIVRRIFEKLGFKVKFLKRIKIGKLSIGGLKPGSHIALTKKDKEQIFA